MDRNPHPAVAASFARENGFVPSDNAQSLDEFWDVYSGRFYPQLKEKVLLAGRSEQKQELEQALSSESGIQRCKGDSLDEVLAFLCAVVRSAEDSTREFLRARTLIVETEEAARKLRSFEGLIMAVRGGAVGAAGMLANEGHRVIVPIGRDTIKPSSTITLTRPSAYEMSEGLQEMGFSSDEALRRAYEELVQPMLPLQMLLGRWGLPDHAEIAALPLRRLAGAITTTGGNTYLIEARW